MEAVTTFVLSAIADACNIEPSAVTPATQLADIGFDSLNATAFVSLVESHYAFEMSQADVVNLYQSVSVAEVIELMGRACAANTDALPLPYAP